MRDSDIGPGSCPESQLIYIFVCVSAVYQQTHCKLLHTGLVIARIQLNDVLGDSYLDVVQSLIDRDPVGESV